MATPGSVLRVEASSACRAQSGSCPDVHSSSGHSGTPLRSAATWGWGSGRVPSEVRGELELGEERPSSPSPAWQKVNHKHGGHSRSEHSSPPWTAPQTGTQRVSPPNWGRDGKVTEPAPGPARCALGASWESRAPAAHQAKRRPPRWLLPPRPAPLGPASLGWSPGPPSPATQLSCLRTCCASLGLSFPFCITEQPSIWVMPWPPLHKDREQGRLSTVHAGHWTPGLPGSPSIHSLPLSIPTASWLPAQWLSVWSSKEVSVQRGCRPEEGQALGSPPRPLLSFPEDVSLLA